jgi:hypothetical protein
VDLATDERTDELLRPFLDAIDAAPDDPMPVAILADRLEEVGDGRHVGLRWLLKKRIRPMRYVPMYGPDRSRWQWLCGGKINPCLPVEAHHLMHDNTYPSASAAYLNAAAAVSTWLTGER